MAIADDHGIVAVRAAHASWPTMLTHKLKTLGLVQQPREIDHLRYRYACAASKTTRSRLHPIRSETWLQRYPARATTQAPNKNNVRYRCGDTPNCSSQMVRSVRVEMPIIWQSS